MHISCPPISIPTLVENIGLGWEHWPELYFQKAVFKSSTRAKLIQVDRYGGGCQFVNLHDCQIDVANCMLALCFSLYAAFLYNVVLSKFDFVTILVSGMVMERCVGGCASEPTLSFGPDMWWNKNVGPPYDVPCEGRSSGCTKTQKLHRHWHLLFDAHVRILPWIATTETTTTCPQGGVPSDQKRAETRQVQSST